jgi:peptidoglycan glycosyltransferase
MRKAKWIIIISAFLWGAVILIAYLYYSTTPDKIFSDVHNKRIRIKERAPIVDGSDDKFYLAHTNAKGRREYPLGAAAAHITGFVSPAVGIGGGLELEYGERLISPGSKWWYFFETNKTNNPLITTVDAKLQMTADAALGKNRGAVVIIKVKTGEILAMVSHPSYDPNNIDKTFKQLNSREEGPLWNRAMKGSYPPGSVWKIISVINLMEKKDVALTCKSLKIGDRTYGCQHPHGHVKGLKQAFAKSCNSYFLQRGLKDLDPEDFFKTSNKFKQKKTGDKATSFDFTQALLGQYPISISPMESALLAASVANDGLKPTPMIVKSTSKSERVFPKETAQVLQKYMTEVVRAGTGRQLSSFIKSGHVIGIKTGTAENEVNGRKTNVTWIVGFAGQKIPDIAYAIVVEDSSKMAADECSPIVAMILQKYFSKQKNKDNKAS